MIKASKIYEYGLRSFVMAEVLSLAVAEGGFTTAKPPFYFR